MESIGALTFELIFIAFPPNPSLFSLPYPTSLTVFSPLLTSDVNVLIAELAELTYQEIFHQAP